MLVLWFLLAWSWVFITDSLDLAGSKPVAMVIALWVAVFNVALSAYIVVKTFKYLSRRFQKTNPWLIMVFGLPLFALMDFVVSWITAIIWLGPQGSVDNVLPLSSPALILINSPLKYVSRFVGFYGLAGFFWLVIFLSIKKQWRKYAMICLAFGGVLSIVGWVLYKTPNGKSIKTTIISEALDQHVESIQNRDSNLVVFPEYSFDNIDNDSLNKRVGKNQDTLKTYFVASAQVNDGRPAGHLNVLRFGNSEDGITDSQNKYRLIPGGEDLAYIVRVMLRATNQKSTLDYFSYAKMVNKGSQQLHTLKVNEDTTLGSAVCSSIIAPKDYRTFASHDATLFTNSASLTIFKGSRVFAWQQKSLARFMSVANARYFLQSANAASAYMLDNNGKQLAEVRGIATKDVVAINNHKKTPYSKIGEFLVATGFLIVSIWLIQYLLEINKSKTPRRKTKKAKKSRNRQSIKKATKMI